jgi:hypothetical protein
VQCTAPLLINSCFMSGFKRSGLNGAEAEPDSTICTNTTFKEISYLVDLRT